MPETSEKDPMVSQSLAGLYLIAAVLLVVTFGWSLYDEFFGLRPWKTYERRFSSLYGAFLEKQIPKQKAAEKAIRESPEFQALDQKAGDLEKSVGPESKKIDDQVALVDQRLSLVTVRYTDARAYVNSVIYQIEHTSSGSGKESIQSDLDKFQQQTFVLSLPVVEAGGKPREDSFTYPKLEEEFKGLQARKAGLLAQKADLLRPVSELRKKRDAYLQDHLNGLSQTQLEGLLNKTRASSVEIRQINNPDAGIVDRCESCHLGTREPVLLTVKDVGGVKDAMAAAFTSHPDLELLSLHDPEKFGCTPCHNGNGMQVDSVEQAHGNYEHWLWPLYPKANSQAGCQQCHASDMVVDHAPALSAGKDLFQYRGCVGCHRFEGYDSEPEDLIATGKQIEQLEAQRGENLRNIQRVTLQGDQASENETARQFYTQADALRLSISDIDLRMDQLNLRTKDLIMGMKKVAPDLKEVRVKIRPQWVPVWITNPHAWRPTTKMPRFRWVEGDVEAVSAFVWQSGLDATLPKQPPGDPVKGKESFETRGCMGCHSVGEGAQAVGGWFAANLTRVGEKDNYDFLVRWIHNPRERTRPYCPFEKRDLTEQDYKKHSLPFVFDLDHSVCPNDGHQLEVEQMTIMPNLRLSWQEARDIASYLMTLKQKDPASYAQAPFLNDPKLKARGKEIVQEYGCAGCHEISGLEDAGRIGTELTKEGSKPLEQFDFALFIRPARDEGWYSQKGFFEHKLANPGMFDAGMIKADGEELKMPNFFEPVNGKTTQAGPGGPPPGAKQEFVEAKDLAPEAKEQVNELTTFLMGSVTSQYPSRYFYLPEGQRKDIQDGWWIVKKYNCMGCHQFQVGQNSVLMGVPRYQTADWKDQLPPKLMTEGARVKPEWLARFLWNPAMSETDTDRDGVRSYLKARMPTFYFSPIEIRKLVRFFQALSSQPMPYVPPKLEPLAGKELEMARALFTSQAAPCLKCHATGDPAHDRFATAPNFLLAPDRLKPDWVKHWILDPAMISPGTAMPSGLFKQQAGHWVFAGPTPPMFTGYDRDHADLLVRYMFEITPEEQRRLLGMGGSSGKTAANFGAPPIGMLAKSH